MAPWQGRVSVRGLGSSCPSAVMLLQSASWSSALSPVWLSPRQGGALQQTSRTAPCPSRRSQPKHRLRETFAVLWVAFASAALRPSGMPVDPEALAEWLLRASAEPAQKPAVEQCCSMLASLDRLLSRQDSEVPTLDAKARTLEEPTHLQAGLRLTCRHCS